MDSTACIAGQLAGSFYGDAGADRQTATKGTHWLSCISSGSTAERQCHYYSPLLLGRDPLQGSCSLPKPRAATLSAIWGMHYCNFCARNLQILNLLQVLQLQLHSSSESVDVDGGHRVRPVLPGGERRQLLRDLQGGAALPRCRRAGSLRRGRRSTPGRRTGGWRTSLRSGRRR
eukprot:SAG22_NODE_276_length_13167_cov_8.415825_7_plen_174_part_00